MAPGTPRESPTPARTALARCAKPAARRHRMECRKCPWEVSFSDGLAVAVHPKRVDQADQIASDPPQSGTARKQDVEFARQSQRVSEYVAAEHLSVSMSV